MVLFTTETLAAPWNPKTTYTIITGHTLDEPETNKYVEIKNNNNIVKSMKMPAFSEFLQTNKGQTLERNEYEYLNGTLFDVNMRGGTRKTKKYNKKTKKNNRKRKGRKH